MFKTRKMLLENISELEDYLNGFSKKGFHYFQTYDYLKSQVLSVSDETERKRIEEEDRLFEERGWKEFFLTIVNSMVMCRECDCIEIGGSVSDSYFLFKACFPDEKNEELLNRDTGEILLFYDSLVLNISVLNLPIRNIIGMTWKLHVGLTLETQIHKFGLWHKYYNNETSNDETFFVSKRKLSEEEVQCVIDSKKRSDDESIDTRRSVLWVKKSLFEV